MATYDNLFNTAFPPNLTDPTLVHLHTPVQFSARSDQFIYEVPDQ